MGYRSQVAIAAKSEVARKLSELYLVKNHSDNLKILNDGDNMQLFACWDMIKWYEEFDEVKEVINILKSSNEDNFLFIEIEESGTTNEMGTWFSNPFNIEVVHEIRWD